MLRHKDAHIFLVLYLKCKWYLCFSLCLEKWNIPYLFISGPWTIQKNFLWNGVSRICIVYASYIWLGVLSRFKIMLKYFFICVSIFHMNSQSFFVINFFNIFYAIVFRRWRPIISLKVGVLPVSLICLSYQRTFHQSGCVFLLSKCTYYLLLKITLMQLLEFWCIVPAPAASCSRFPWYILFDWFVFYLLKHKTCFSHSVSYLHLCAFSLNVLLRALWHCVYHIKNSSLWKHKKV